MRRESINLQLALTNFLAQGNGIPLLLQLLVLCTLQYRTAYSIRTTTMMMMMKSYRFALLTFLVKCCVVVSFAPRWDTSSVCSKQQKSNTFLPRWTPTMIELQPCRCAFRYAQCRLFSSKDTVRACLVACLRVSGCVFALCNDNRQF
jgi:hypothetical protein